jgi:DNA-binding transcriptional MerR regulator
MKKTMPQITLDFGPEYSSPPPREENGETSDHLIRQYMAAGVGVRIKSLKNAKEASGDLFGGQEESPVPTAPTVPTAETVPTIPTAETIPTTETAETTPAAESPEPAETLPTDEPEPAEIATARIPRRATQATETAAPKAVKSKRGRKSLKQVSAEADLIEIPADDILFAKQYYTMGEVSVMFRVNQSLLRFWETEFDILQPRKNKKGDRYFRPVDIKNLHLIYHLLRQRKYTIEGAKDFLKKNKKAEERFEAIQRLQEIRAFLQEWKGQMDY